MGAYDDEAVEDVARMRITGALLVCAAVVAGSVGVLVIWLGQRLVA